MRTLALLLFFIFSGLFAFGQSVGDYRSSSGGSWNDSGIWERYNGSTWVPAPSAPTSSDGVILIQNAHTVTVPAAVNVSADQVILAGNLVVDATGTFNLTNGTGTDLIIVNGAATLSVNGTFVRQNLTEISNPFSSANILYGPGSAYSHRYTTTVGDLPSSTWDPTSTVFLTAFSNTSAIVANSTWDQIFGNITYSSSGQRGFVDFGGNIKHIRGNLAVLNTGNHALRLSETENYNLTIGQENSEVGGNLSVSGNARLYFSVSGNVTCNIHGDINFTAYNSNGSYLTFTGNTSINLYGAFNMTSNGKLRMAGSGSTGVGILNLYGDFNLNAGQIEEAGVNPTHGQFNFLAAGVQNFNKTGTIAGYMKYYISPQTTLNLGLSALTGSSVSTFTLDGGTIVLGSLEPQGALYAGALGNIQTPVNYRSYASGSTIEYAGAGVQVMGNGHPTGAGINTVINNPSGVNVVSNTTIAGQLALQSGILNFSDYSLTLSGTLINSGGAFGANNASSLNIAGSADGEFGEIVFDPSANTIGTLNVNRTGSNVNATVSEPLIIASALTLRNGSLTNNGAISMMDNSLLTRYENGMLAGSSVNTIAEAKYDLIYRSTSSPGGPFAAFISGLEISADPAVIRNFLVNTAQAQDQVHLSQELTVHGSVSLNKGFLSQGSFNINMRGPSWFDNGGALIPGNGVVIFEATTEVNGSANPLFGNIQASSVSNVNFLRNLSIEGNINFLEGSTINFNNNVITFSGSQAQAVSANGAAFPFITIEKGSSQGITLTSPLNLTGVLQFGSPSNNVNFQSNGFLNLVSTSDGPGSGTAQIFRLRNSNRISGNVTVNRYMSGEGLLYRYFSSPVSNASVAQLKDDFLVQGNFIDPSPTTKICGVKASASSPTLYYYDETVPGAIEQGYIAYPGAGTSSANSPLIPGRGYASYMRQCEPTVVDFVGSINQGNLSLPVTFTASDPEGDGWNLVGNPYPSTIDWDLGWSKTNISPAIAITDNGSGMVRYYEAGVTNEIPNGYIAVGQGFWVRATGPNPSLRINETVKVLPVAEYFREAPKNIPSFVIALSNGADEDYAYVKMVAEAKATLDDFDAPKIQNPEFSLSTLTHDNYSMAINAMQDLSCGMVLPLKTQGLKAGSYSFRIDTRGFFQEYQFVLIDGFTGNENPIENASFDFVVNEDSASAGLNRFSIRVEEKTNFDEVNITNISACSEDIAIDLDKIQPGVKYAAWTIDGRQMTEPQAGSSNSMTLSFTAELLNGSSAELEIRASGVCGGSRVVSTPFMITRNIPVLTGLSSEFSCINGSVNLVAITNSPDAIVNWYAEQNDATPVFTGAVFETPELKKNKTYFAEAVSASGCASPRQAITTDVVTGYTPPTLSVSGSTLMSSYSEGNQWYFENQILEDEKGSSLMMNKSGQYSLVVNVKGCTTRLDYFREEGKGISYYPNPVADFLTIQGIEDDVLEIQLTSAIGMNLGSVYKKGENFSGQVNLQSLPDGVYLLIVTKANQRLSHRIIKGKK